jgi:pyruvate formate lyase activating enzyme
VKNALASGSFGIAYTYSEPLIHFEYLMEAAELARAANLKNVLVTNGYLNEEPARALLPLIDAANIDLKSFNPGFYRRELGGKLESVTSFIAIAAPLIHVEITTLVIPGKTDAPEEIDEIARFIGSIDSRIPLHRSCYHPMYRYRIPPTPAETHWPSQPAPNAFFTTYTRVTSGPENLLTLSAKNAVRSLSADEGTMFGSRGSMTAVAPIAGILRPVSALEAVPRSAS